MPINPVAMMPKEGLHPDTPHDADEGLRYLLRGQDEPAIQRLIIRAWRTCTEGVADQALTHLGVVLKALAEQAAKNNRLAAPQSSPGNSGSPSPIMPSPEARNRAAANSAIVQHTVSHIVKEVKPLLGETKRLSDLIHTAALQVENSVERAQRSARELGDRARQELAGSRRYITGLEATILVLSGFAIGHFFR